MLQFVYKWDLIPLYTPNIKIDTQKYVVLAFVLHEDGPVGKSML
jgi:hypothetical protein